ncbi:MAG: hypothetical protein JRG91_16490, partial [Deltaproteobacteria bacterium]|nr:hypothetical protein [Deltaproteobacteria bacterium]
WEPGPTDAEVYVGYTGIGLGREEGGPQVEYLQGFGLGHTLSAFLSATVQAAGDTSAGFAGGFFGTPLDSDHVDLDLMLVLGQEWRRLEDFSVGAAFELNLDLAPDLSLFGVYMRGCVHLGGALHVGVETILGTYVTLSERHQILLEADAEFALNPSDRWSAVQIGGIALGYNVRLHDAVELITELFLDIPQAGESFSTGVMVGLILTMPSSGEGLHM